MKANTVAHYLTKPESGPARRKLVIVDEASLLGSKDLMAIHERVKNGDQLLLVGDPKQHSGMSASAGGIFAKLQELKVADNFRMKEIVRQKEAAPGIAETVRLLAEKKPQQALELLQKHQRIEEITDNNERLTAVVDKFVKTSESQDTLVLTMSNAEKNKLNQMIRERLIEVGKIEADGVTIETNRHKNLRGEEKNFAFSYKQADHFYISEALADFRRGSQGQILEVDPIKNTVKAKLQGFGKSKIVTIDLDSQGHHLSAYETDQKEFAVGDTVSFLKPILVCHSF